MPLSISVSRSADAAALNSAAKFPPKGLVLYCVTNKTLKEEMNKRGWSTHSTHLIVIQWGFKSLQQTSSEAKWEYGSKNWLVPLLEKRDGRGHQEREIMENLCSPWKALLAWFNSLNSGKISVCNSRALTCSTVWKPDVWSVGGEQQMHNKWRKPSGYREMWLLSALLMFHDFNSCAPKVSHIYLANVVMSPG